MDKVQLRFLAAMRAAMEGREVQWTDMTGEEWAALLKLAQIHRVLPLVFQAVYRSAEGAEPGFLQPWRAQVRQQVMIQAQKTAEFLPLLDRLQAAGVAPLVVKGITCRGLYPNPDYRMSSDEDILIPAEKFPDCHRCMEAYGMTTKDQEGTAYEVPYFQEGGVLYIEVHKSLFPAENEAYGGLNRFFSDVRSRAVVQNGIPTLAPGDHLRYLIFHAYKHFLHSGFGIRQVCDLVLFANTFGREVDWEGLLADCRSIRAEKFAAAVFRIGEGYLGFDPDRAGWPESWRGIHVDTEPLLGDILAAGIYGGSDANRLHSGSLTLQAMAAQRQGGRKPGLLKTLFPPAKALEGRYPYLKDKPILLPVAWVSRLVKYGTAARSGEKDPGESLRIGRERIALLKTYGILDEK